VNNATLERVQGELADVLTGRKFGKVFPLSRRVFAIDFRIPQSRYLFINTEPASPRIYLIHRGLKELEQASENTRTFHLLMKRHLSNADLVDVDKLPDERVLILEFKNLSEMGETLSPSLVIQLTGRSSNVFLLDANGCIVGSLTEKDIDGQRIAEKYSPPARPPARKDSASETSIEPLPEVNGSICAALDRFYLQKESEERFHSRSEAARRSVDREISKRKKLVERLNDDLRQHGDAERWKRFGDLLLANIATAKRNGDRLIVTDYFDDNAPKIEIEADENISLTDAAQAYFKRYSKALNAAAEIDRRLKTVKAEIAGLEAKRVDLAQAIEAKDASFFADDIDNKRQKKDKKEKQRFSGARQFTSSDGFEILVGKKAVDNDYLTFRIAGSLDLWLHAADYPGSHVVVRNPNRKNIPHRTLLQSA